MTINDIITEVDNQKPNQYTDEDKVRWISVCEGKIIDSVFSHYTDVIGDEFDGYTIDDINEEVLVPDTYADIYKYYLWAMIDSTNGEANRYQTSMILYNNAMQDFASYYNKIHKHIQIPLSVFGKKVNNEITTD